MQPWMEKAMMEKERLEKNIQPPDPWRLQMLMQVMHIFDSRIYNDDRNLGNILITEDWLLILIDHTRAFLKSPEPFKLEKIRYCDRNLLANLKGLSFETLGPRVKDFLTTDQIHAVLKEETSSWSI